MNVWGLIHAVRFLVWIQALRNFVGHSRCTLDDGKDTLRWVNIIHACFGEVIVKVKACWESYLLFFVPASNSKSDLRPLYLLCAL